MKQVMYTGPGYVRVLWGVEFPTNQPVLVTNPDLIYKAGFLDHFVILDDEAEEEPVEEIAADWQNLHWKQKVKLARDLTGLTCANGSEADEVLTAHFEGKLNA